MRECLPARPVILGDARASPRYCHPERCRERPPATVILSDAASVSEAQSRRTYVFGSSPFRETENGKPETEDVLPPVIPSEREGLPNATRDNAFALHFALAVDPCGGAGLKPC
jgi:hypothetical protein